IIIILLSVAMNLILSPRIDFETQMREQFAERGMTEQQIDDAMENVAKFQKFSAWFALAFSVVTLVLIAALFLLIAKVFGGEGTYKQFLSVTEYAWMPQILKALLLTLLVWRAGKVDSVSLQTLLKSNLGFLADPAEAPALFALLSSIDVFSFATIGLMAIGYGHASRMGTRKMAVAVVVVYAVWVGIRTGLAALQG
ncbi:MAG: YIP1 family protein, partial [Thermoanaerobaculia bacterium]